jgi:hypothetical protein
MKGRGCVNFHNELVRDDPIIIKMAKERTRIPGYEIGDVGAPVHPCSPSIVFPLHNSSALNRNILSRQPREERWYTYDILHLVGSSVHDKCNNKPIKTQYFSENQNQNLQENGRRQSD